MRIIEDVKLDFADVLLVPKRSELESRSEVVLQRTFQFKHSDLSFCGIPIVAANMDGVGTFEMAEALGNQCISTCLTKHYDVNELKLFYKTPSSDYAIYSMGMTAEDVEKYDQVRANFVCVDVANGYTSKFSDFIKRFRDKYPHIILMAGNVATPDMTNQLLLDGADIVKVGIGPGNACSTRIKTGVGYPQLSAIIECADAAHGIGGWIVGDGGITSPGDAAKAFAAGADFVMIGTMFAGHTEGGGKVTHELVKSNVIGNTTVTGSLTGLDTPKYHERIDMQQFVEFYGMSSKKAQEAHGSSLKNYRASEGRVLRVPYKGPVEPTIQDLLGGLRSACTYSGALSLKDLPKCATFVKVNRQISTLHGVGQL
jgi:GMP reductase